MPISNPILSTKASELASVLNISDFKCNNRSAKLKLLVIRKFQKQRCFKGIKTVQYEYVSNPIALIT